MMMVVVVMMMSMVIMVSRCMMAVLMIADIMYIVGSRWCMMRMHWNLFNSDSHSSGGGIGLLTVLCLTILTRETGSLIGN